MEKVKRTPAKLPELVAEFNMEVLNKAPNFNIQTVTISDVNRPALQLVGFYEYFEPIRLQILGKAEMVFLQGMTTERRRKVLEDLLRCEIPALIIARNMEVPPELLELAEKHGRTLLRIDRMESARATIERLRIDRKTVDATSEIIDYLNKKLAPQITRHGVLMNINGQGVLLLGDSGIGKSETAIELLKRGHRLVADDAVDIRRISTSLYGTAPELIRHYIEIRGVGVIDVQQLFGMGAVQFDTEIDLVVQLEQWQDGKFYDRLGLGEETYEILGVKLPYMIVPVRPGRNLAGIVEIATMKNRQMKYGYNPARDFVTRLDQHYDALNEANRRKSK